MVRTQIQLPDELYRRARHLAKAREISLAELTRRGLEQILAVYPEPSAPPDKWEFPVVKGRCHPLSAEQLRDLLRDEEEGRDLRSIRQKP